MGERFEWAPWVDRGPDYHGPRAESGRPLYFIGSRENGERYVEKGTRDEEGNLARQRVFIRSRVLDNPYVDPEYRSTLLNLDPISRAREETTELNAAHVNHEISDAWEAPIEQWIAARHLALEAFTTADVLSEALSKPRGQWSRADEMRVSDILRRTGWKLGNKPKGKARSWVRK